MKKIWIFLIIAVILCISIIFYKMIMLDTSSQDTNQDIREINKEIIEQEENKTEGKNLTKQNQFIVYSPSFEDKGKIPVKYCDVGISGGQNISIPITWKNIPEKANSLFLVIVDPHPVAKNWIHWIVKNIPTDANGLEENASANNMPKGSVQLQGTQKDPFYHGPQPPAGTGSHPYEIHLFALKQNDIQINDRPTWEDILNTIKPQTIEEAIYTGYYP